MDTKPSRTDRAISEYVRSAMKQKRITQMQITFKIGRKAQSYVSNRLNGKYSWNISDLDTIAPMLGLPNALSLISIAVGYAA